MENEYLEMKNSKRIRNIKENKCVGGYKMSNRVDIIKPGLFSKQVNADNRRIEFDYKNEVIVSNKIAVDYVFIGDSITHMWELNAYFGKSQRLILNRGIGGDTNLNPNIAY
jgi:hypothetical protein